MRTPPKHHRLRIPLPRWPSKDDRDYRSVSALAAWRVRRAQPARCAAAHEARSGSPLPSLTAIARVRREGAVLHVELLARRASVGDRSSVLARDGAGAPFAGGARDAAAVSCDEARTWTVSLPLN